MYNPQNELHFYLALTDVTVTLYYYVESQGQNEIERVKEYIVAVTLDEENRPCHFTNASKLAYVSVEHEEDTVLRAVVYGAGYGHAIQDALGNINYSLSMNHVRDIFDVSRVTNYFDAITRETPSLL